MTQAMRRSSILLIILLTLCLSIVYAKLARNPIIWVDVPIYITKDIGKGDWKEVSFAPLLHDHLFFDDGGRVYMITSGGNLRLVELKPDMSDIKEGN